MTIRELREGIRLPIVPDLGPGEVEVIALGLQHPDPLVILDDALGRKIAQLNDLRLTGTLGVLLRGKVEGLISEVAPLLNMLRETGMRMSEMLVARVLREAGE